MSWATGNFYVSGGYSHRDGIRNIEAPWASGEIYSAAGVPRFTGTQCNSPVGTETRWFRFGAGATQFTNNPAAPGAGTAAVGTGSVLLGCGGRLLIAAVGGSLGAERWWSPWSELASVRSGCPSVRPEFSASGTRICL